MTARGTILELVEEDGYLDGAVDPLDCPPGAHWADWFLFALRNILGEQKAAAYLGVNQVGQ